MSISTGKSVGRVGHEIIGEEYLRGLGFGEKVCRLVGSHVAAKRCVFSLLPSNSRNWYIVKKEAEMGGLGI